MRKLAAALFGISMLIGTSAGAQKAEGESAEDPNAKARAQLIVNNLQLKTKEDLEAFLDVYADYRADHKKLTDERTKIMSGHGAEFGAISDDNAIELLKEMQGLQKKSIELKQKYVKRFAKVLPPMQVLRYYQVESKLEAIKRMEQVRRIPLNR